MHLRKVITLACLPWRNNTAHLYTDDSYQSHLISLSIHRICIREMLIHHESPLQGSCSCLLWHSLWGAYSCCAGQCTLEGKHGYPEDYPYPNPCIPSPSAALCLCVTKHCQCSVCCTQRWSAEGSTQASVVTWHRASADFACSSPLMG